MDLAKALEMLSIHVRSQVSNPDEHQPGQNDANRVAMQVDDQTSNTQLVNQLYRDPQSILYDFDKSIETLLAQMHQTEVTLSNAGPQPTTSLKEGSKTHESVPRYQFDPYSSDSSSSSSNESNDFGSSAYCSMVEDLLREDVYTITSSITNVGRLLELCVEMKKMYFMLQTTYVSDYFKPKNPRKKELMSILDRAKYITDSYRDSCLREPLMRNLPLIYQFEKYCEEITELVEYKREQVEEYSNSIQIIHPPGTKIDQDYLSSSDESSFTNWTDNKLYVHRSP